MRVMLHLGAHKTATTSLQRQLAVAQKKQVLTQADITYAPRQEKGKRTPLYQLLARRYRTPDALADARERVKKEVLKLVGNPQSQRLILSDENLMGPALPTHFLKRYIHDDDQQTKMYPQLEWRIANLCALFKDFDLSLHFTVRRWETYLPSKYQHYVESGGLLTQPAFIRSLNDQTLDWPGIVGRMRESAGPVPVHINAFEALKLSGMAFVENLFPISGLADALASLGDLPRSKQRHSAASMALIRTTNRLWRQNDPLKAWNATLKLRPVTRRLDRILPPGKTPLGKDRDRLSDLSDRQYTILAGITAPPRKP